MGNSALAQEIGFRIRALRKDRKWSQRLLADKLHINKSVISYYELGERFPSYDVLLNIADIFHVTTDYLLKGDQERQLTITGLTEAEYSAISVIVDGLQHKNKDE